MKVRSEWGGSGGRETSAEGVTMSVKAVIVGALEEMPDFGDGQGGICRI